MGLVILGSEIEQGCSNLKSSASSGKTAADSMVSSLEAAVNDTTLQGSAYNNLKMLLLTTYYPTCLRLKNGMESLETGATGVLSAFHGSGLGGELLKEDELIQKVQSLESQISSLTYSLSSLEANDVLMAASYQNMIAGLRSQVAVLKNKIQKMHNFNSGGSGKCSNAISILETCSSLASNTTIPSGTDISGYVTKMNFNITPDKFPIIMNDLKNDIPKYGKSVWEYHTQSEYLETLIANGSYDITKYQEQLAKELEKAGLGTREAVVAAATFWATNFPRLQYFWGGKSNNSHNDDNSLGYDGVVAGINPDWGKPTKIVDGGSKSTPPGTIVNLGLDCSGMVAWALQTGGCGDKENPLRWSQTGAQQQAETLGKYVQIGGVGYDPAKVKPGDIVSIPPSRDEHIGIVIARNDDKIACAHSSGSGKGTTVDIINVNTGECYTNHGDKYNRDTVDYFTHVTYMDDYYNQFKK